MKNRHDEDVYTVKGSFFSFPKKFIIYDMKGNKLSTIKRKYFTVFPAFTINTQNESITLRKKLSLARMKFTIDNSDWKLRGDFLDHEYDVTRGSRPIMRLSKHWFRWGDSYELDIQDEKDALLCLSIVIAVDYALYLSKNSK